MMKEKISEAVTNIDAKHIEEAARFSKTEKKKSSHFLQYALTTAACFCIAAGGLYLWNQVHTSDKVQPNQIIEQNNAPVVSDEGIFIPQKELDMTATEDGMLADMLGFFIYQGRSYLQYEYLENTHDLVGEKLGTSDGLIDCMNAHEEWINGYKEGAGSIAGDFYSVNGYDPTFMLCMKMDDGLIQTFINDNNITLQYGKELFAERLHFDGDYESLSYQTYEDWNSYDGHQNFQVLEEEQRPLAQEFITALNEANFMLIDDIPLPDEFSNIYDLELYHLYFQQENGMMIHLRLYEGGYVRLQHFYQVCVQVEPEIFDRFIQVLEN